MLVLQAERKFDGCRKARFLWHFYKMLAIASIEARKLQLAAMDRAPILAFCDGVA